MLRLGKGHLDLAPGGEKKDNYLEKHSDKDGLEICQSKVSLKSVR